MSSVDVYSVGIVHASVCAPKAMPVNEVVAEANRRAPTGLDHEWILSREEQFSGGQSNPCLCDHDPERTHYLLDC
jgi:hypothetical protein